MLPLFVNANYLKIDNIPDHSHDLDGASIQKAYKKGYEMFSQKHYYLPHMGNKEPQTPWDYQTVNPKIKYAHPYFQILMRHMAEHFYFKVFYSVRSEAQQRDLYNRGKTKTLNSYHLERMNPLGNGSLAIDVVLLDDNGKALWNSLEDQAFFIGATVATAYRLKADLYWPDNVEFRAGINFKMDCKIYNASFMDAWHLEIRIGVPWKCKPEWKNPNT